MEFPQGCHRGGIPGSQGYATCPGSHSSEAAAVPFELFLLHRTHFTQDTHPVPPVKDTWTAMGVDPASCGVCILPASQMQLPYSTSCPTMPMVGGAGLYLMSRPPSSCPPNTSKILGSFLLWELCTCCPDFLGLSCSKMVLGGSFVNS